jgi:outer membrane protein W
MKKITLAVIAVLVFGFANAQKKEGFRVGLELGYVPTSGGLGIEFALEPKYNIKDNMNVGLKISGTAIISDVSNNQYNIVSGTSQSISSYTATYDYYFNEPGKSFVPYAGGGLGINSIKTVKLVDISKNDINNIETENKLGILLRGAFEWGKFRMGLEYNILPQSKLYNQSGTQLGNVSSSYFAIDLGFYLGGGKWGK